MITPVFRDYRAWRAKWTEARVAEVRDLDRAAAERSEATARAPSREQRDRAQGQLLQAVAGVRVSARRLTSLGRGLPFDDDDREFADDARPRRRARRPHRGVSARQGRGRCDRAGGRGAGRRAGQDRRGRRLPLRSGRPSLLHEVGRGRRAVARGARRRVPAASTHVAHLLEQALPRLSAARARRDQEARPGRAHPLHGLVPPRCGAPEQGRRLLRGLGLEPLRPAPVRALLQVVHREALGRADHGDPRRMGRPADQGPLLLLRCQGGVLRQQGKQGEEPDLGVPLSALRPGADVGGDELGDRRGRRRRAHRRPGGAVGAGR